MNSDVKQTTTAAEPLLTFLQLATAIDRAEQAVAQAVKSVEARANDLRTLEVEHMTKEEAAKSLLGLAKNAVAQEQATLQTLCNQLTSRLPSAHKEQVSPSTSELKALHLESQKVRGK